MLNIKEAFLLKGRVIGESELQIHGGRQRSQLTYAALLFVQNPTSQTFSVSAFIDDDTIYLVSALATMALRIFPAELVPALD